MKIDFPEKHLCGSRRTNIDISDWMDNWFVGTGKDEFCYLEGTWQDMVSLAKQILSSENTKIVSPDDYHPEMRYQNE